MSFNTRLTTRIRIPLWQYLSAHIGAKRGRSGEKKRRRHLHLRPCRKPDADDLDAEWFQAGRSRTIPTTESAEIPSTQTETRFLPRESLTATISRTVC